MRNASARIAYIASSRTAHEPRINTAEALEAVHAVVASSDPALRDRAGADPLCFGYLFGFLVDTCWSPLDIFMVCLK